MNQLAGKALLLQGIDLIKGRMEALDPEITAPQENQRHTDRPPIGGSVSPQNVGALPVTVARQQKRAQRRLAGKSGPLSIPGSSDCPS